MDYLVWREKNSMINKKDFFFWCFVLVRLFHGTFIFFSFLAKKGKKTTPQSFDIVLSSDSVCDHYRPSHLREVGWVWVVLEGHSVGWQEQPQGKGSLPDKYRLPRWRLFIPENRLQKVQIELCKTWMKRIGKNHLFLLVVKLRYVKWSCRVAGSEPEGAYLK